jgi:hypothetical protein
MSSDSRDDHEEEIDHDDTDFFSVAAAHISADAQHSPDTEDLLRSNPFLRQQLGLSGIGLDGLEDNIPTTSVDHDEKDELPLISELDGFRETTVSFDSVEDNQGQSSNIPPTRKKNFRMRKASSENSLVSRIKKRKIGNFKNKQRASSTSEETQPGDSQLPA